MKAIMRKIFFMALSISLVSCSSDDNGSKAITFSNMVGKWNVKSVVKSDGTIIPYAGSCPTQKDFFEISPWGDVVENEYLEDCATITQSFCDSFGIDENHVIFTSCSDLDEGEVTSITDNTLRIEYPVPTNINFMHLYANDAKAIVFEKRE